MASSPKISPTRTFLVKWGGTGDDGDGAGLSGAYNVERSFDGENWEPWEQFNTDGSAIYGDDEITRQGETYYFRAGAIDNVKNKVHPEAAQCSTTVDTTYADTDPPGPPIELRANGELYRSNWSNESVFNITWKNPDDPSGIAKAYYKLGAPAPKDTSDYTEFLDASTSGFALDVGDSEYGVWVYVWLKDHLGNVDIANRDSLLLRYDGTLPKIDSLRVDRYQAFYNDVYWFNPDSTDEIRIDLSFEELYPASAEINTDLPKGLIAIAPFDTGAFHRMQFVLKPTAVDGLYDVTITITDSASGQVDTTFVLGIDSTPPAGATARSEPVSRKKSIPVYWHENDSGDDGQGSGYPGFTVYRCERITRIGRFGRKKLSENRLYTITR